MNLDALKEMAAMGLTIDQAIALFEKMAKPTDTRSAERQARYRERLSAHGMTGSQWKKKSGFILARDGFSCAYCSSEASHCDHVAPLIQGGTNDDANLVAACPDCNFGKSGRTVEQWKGSEWAAAWRLSRYGNGYGNTTNNNPSPSPSLEGSPKPPPITLTLSPSPAVVITDAGEPVDWNTRLEAARLIAGPALDPTAIACHHFRDLKALCEPVSGEPCEWGEVLDAIRMVGERQAQRGKPLRTWAWVRDDAIALRDKRLQGNPEPVVVAFQPKSQSPPSGTGWRDQERIAAENWEASRKLLFPKDTVS